MDLLISSYGFAYAVYDRQLLFTEILVHKHGYQDTNNSFYEVDERYNDS